MKVIAWNLAHQVNIRPILEDLLPPEFLEKGAFV
jgi:hypothetical protein